MSSVCLSALSVCPAKLSSAKILDNGKKNQDVSAQPVINADLKVYKNGLYI